MTRRRYGLLGCALAAAAILASGCSESVSGTGHYGTDDSGDGAVAASSMAALLPSATDAADIAHTGPLGAPRTYTTLPAAVAGPSSPACATTLMIGGGYSNKQTDVQGEAMTENIGKTPSTVDVAVVRFADRGAAHSFLDSLTTSWAECSGKLITFAGDTDNWVAGPPQITYGVHTVTRAKEGGQGFGCARAVEVHANLIVDVTTCNSDRGVVASRSARLATWVLDKI